MGPGRKPQRAICILGVLQGLKNTKVSKHNNGVTGEAWQGHTCWLKSLTKPHLGHMEHGTLDIIQKQSKPVKNECMQWVGLERVRLKNSNF